MNVHMYSKNLILLHP